MAINVLHTCFKMWGSEWGFRHACQSNSANFNFMLFEIHSSNIASDNLKQTISLQKRTIQQITPKLFLPFIISFKLQTVLHFIISFKLQTGLHFIISFKHKLILTFLWHFIFNYILDWTHTWMLIPPNNTAYFLRPSHEMLCLYHPITPHSSHEWLMSHSWVTHESLTTRYATCLCWSHSRVTHESLTSHSWVTRRYATCLYLLRFS